MLWRCLASMVMIGEDEENDNSAESEVMHGKNVFTRRKCDPDGSHQELRRGQWTNHKYQNLFDLVKLYLRVKAYQKYDAGNRQFRDNIVWEDISKKLTTRNRKNCCIKC